ncbi:transmembrane channel-like protein 5 [Gastrophryne carolinensis]
MALNDDDGFYNSAYYDSETLEIDKGLQSRPSSRQNSSFRQNPYDESADSESSIPRMNDWRGGRGLLQMANIQPEEDYNVHIPRYPQSNEGPFTLGQYNPTFEADLEHGPSYIDLDKNTDDTHDATDGALRRRSRRQTAIAARAMQPSFIAKLDPALEMQIEDNNKQEKQKFVQSLVEMSNPDIAKEIRKLPTCLNEKRDLRNQVMKLKQKTSKDSYGMNCCAGCLQSVNVSFRRYKQTTSDTFEAFKLWHGALKVIGGQFGSSILSYFIFLKWLLMFNIFSFVVNFSFITIPQFVDMPPNNLTFSGLELLTGAGYFEKTVLYYGFYSNGTIRKEANLAPYNMQLAYIFTIGLYLVTCFLILLFSMAKSFKKNFINPASFSGSAAKLLCSWDFSITNEKAVKLKKKHLSTHMKETLSDMLLEKLHLTFGQRLARLAIHLAAWIASTGMTIGCCAGVYFLCVKVGRTTQGSNYNDLTKQAATLVVAVVVSLINLIMPLVYAMFGLVEKFKYPRHEIYVVILRNVVLKISVIGILCYYWLEEVAEGGFECWESYVGQDIYRLVVIDFLFVLAGSFFGEFIRRIIGTYCLKKWGKPEFDIARNVLDLIYAQTLAWIGIFFSPLLPIIQMIKIFIIFYVKRVSLMMNCTPPRRAWRASHMTTIFIFLLFFPSFIGVLCMIAVTVWRRTPSQTCGPFRTLAVPFDSINDWITSITPYENSKWVVWIYNHIVESVLFFYILTMIVLIISYLYWQIVQGRKIMIKHLLEQIANEGKDKSFLIPKLREAQKMNAANHRAPHQKPQVQPSHEAQDMQLVNEPELQQAEPSSRTSALALAMRARQQADLEEDSPPMNRRSPRDSDNMAGTGRDRNYEEEPTYTSELLNTTSVAMRSPSQAPEEQQPRSSNAMEMIMRARQQAEYEEQLRYNEEPSNAMEMVMRERQMGEYGRQPSWD